MSAVDSQPEAIPPPEVPKPSRLDGVKTKLAHIKEKVTTREGWVGDYDYAWWVRRLSLSESFLTRMNCSGYACPRFRS